MNQSIIPTPSSMPPYIMGSLVLQSKKRVDDFIFPSIRDAHIFRGQHVLGQYNGHWTVHTNIDEQTNSYLPQRYKQMQILSTHPALLDPLRIQLETLDSQYEGSRQLYKLGKLLKHLHYMPAHASLVNINATQDTPRSGYFYLLSKSQPIYLTLIIDQDIDSYSVRLVWSTFDVVNSLKKVTLNPNRYVFFRFSPIRNRPIFLHSHLLCSRWYAFTKAFEDKPLGILTAANALENLIYKDVNVPY